MPTFRGTKNLHIGEDIHAEREPEGRDYIITLDDKKAAALSDYLASEGFVREGDASSDAE